MKECDSSENQRWTLREGGFLRHNKLNVCLDSRDQHDHGVTAQRCNSALDTQRWKFVANAKYAWDKAATLSATMTMMTLTATSETEMETGRETESKTKAETKMEASAGIVAMKD